MTIDPKTTSSVKRFSWWRWALLGLVSVVIVWYAVLSIGVFAAGWQGAKTRALLRVTPLPAAWYDWHIFSYANYLDQQNAVQHYTDYLAESTSGAYQRISSPQAGATALSTMIRLVAAQRALHDLRVTVSASDIDQAYQAQLTQIGSANQVAETIKQLYGWTPERFKDVVIRASVVQDKLQEKLSFDEKLSASAKKQAETVLGLVNADPEHFTDLAKKYSDDSYGANGGDLGFVTKGEQLQAIDDVAFSLDTNQISGLVHTKYGYHILKVTEKKTVDGQDQVHLYQITVLATQVDDYLNNRLKGQAVGILVPSLHWDTTKQRVSP